MKPDTFSPAVADLLAEDRLPELGPGKPNEEARGKLAGLTPAKLFSPLPVADQDAAACCLAALWLRHGYLEEAHKIVQELESRSSSYWHAILHRREPDSANAGYWFRRVEQHPVLAPLKTQARELGYDYTDPFAFIDFVEQVRGRGTPDEELAKRVQQLEWRLLFDDCYREAVGG